LDRPTKGLKYHAAHLNELNFQNFKKPTKTQKVTSTWAGDNSKTSIVINHIHITAMVTSQTSQL